MKKPRLGNLFDRKASVQLKIFLSLAVFGIASALLLGTIFASGVLATNIIIPASNDMNFSTYLSDINVTNGVNTNCTYSIANDSLQMGPTALLPDESTGHNLSIPLDISSLADGPYNISVFCMNSTNAANNETVNRSFNKDATAPGTSATAVKDDSSGYTFNTWTNSTYVNVT